MVLGVKMTNITILGKNIAIALSVVMLLGACQEKPNLKEIEAKLEQKKSADNTSAANETLKVIDQSLSGANKISSAKEVKFSTVPYVYELPKAMQDACNFNPNNTNNINQETSEPSLDNNENGFCTKINIELTKIEPLWVEQIVNKKITNDDNPKLIKFKQTIDEFVAEHLTFINDTKTMAKEDGEEFTGTIAYSLFQKPELLPSVNNLVQVVIYSDVFMGGAHGMPNAEYLIFDMDLQSQIAFNDMIKSEKLGDIHALYYDAFKAYLAKELEITKEKDIREYEETWAFKLSENFYLNQEGLVMVYQPYEMGSYAQGFIELTVPYDKLGEILKVQYLPNIGGMN